MKFSQKLEDAISSQLAAEKESSERWVIDKSFYGSQPRLQTIPELDTPFAPLPFTIKTTGVESTPKTTGVESTPKIASIDWAGHVHEVTLLKCRSAAQDRDAQGRLKSPESIKWDSMVSGQLMQLSADDGKPVGFKSRDKHYMDAISAFHEQYLCYPQQVATQHTENLAKVSALALAGLPGGRGDSQYADASVPELAIATTKWPARDTPLDQYLQGQPYVTEIFD